MRKIILLITILLLILTSCSTQSQANNKEQMALAISVMPAVDTAPIFLAKENGYFEALDLDVKLKSTQMLKTDKVHYKQNQ